MIEIACPWELSKRLVNLGFSSNSAYKWVHPWQDSYRIENKTRYIIVDRIAVLSRKNYPAYSIEEILHNLPEDYILGRMGDRWYCKSFSETFSDVVYYDTPILACAYTAIYWLEQKGGLRNTEDRKVSEVEVK